MSNFNALFAWATRHALLDEFCIFTNRYAIELKVQEDLCASAHNQDAMILRSVIRVFGRTLEEAASNPQSPLTKVAIVRDFVERYFPRLVQTAKPIVSAMRRGKR